MGVGDPNRYETRPDGTHYQVCDSEKRGDLCFRGREPGWYWHDLTDLWAIDEKTVTGPFQSTAAAMLGGLARKGPEGTAIAS